MERINRCGMGGAKHLQVMLQLLVLLSGLLGGLHACRSRPVDLRLLIKTAGGLPSCEQHFIVAAMLQGGKGLVPHPHRTLPWTCSEGEAAVGINLRCWWLPPRPPNYCNCLWAMHTHAVMSCTVQSVWWGSRMLTAKTALLWRGSSVMTAWAERAAGRGSAGGAGPSSCASPCSPSR